MNKTVTLQSHKVKVIFTNNGDRLMLGIYAIADGKIRRYKTSLYHGLEPRKYSEPVLDNYCDVAIAKLEGYLQ